MISRAMVWFFGGSVFAFVALLSGQKEFSFAIFVCTCVAAVVSAWAAAVRESES